MIYYLDKNKNLNEVVKKNITYTPGTDIEFVNNLDGTVTINNIATTTTIDGTLSDTSQNAVENRVIKSKLDSLNLSIQTNKTAILSVKTDLETHINQGEIHVTNEEKQIISKFGQSSDGKLTFDGIEYGSGGNITVDDTLSSTSTNPVQNKIVTDALNGKAESSHIHSVVTTSANGFMASADKSKLDGIDTGANKTIVDTALSSTSTNPVQNKIVTNKITNLESTVNAIPKVTYSLNGTVLTITTS